MEERYQRKKFEQNWFREGLQNCIEIFDYLEDLEKVSFHEIDEMLSNGSSDLKTDRNETENNITKETY